MNQIDSEISEDFAKQLLMSLYKLDTPIGALDILISKTDDTEIKDALFEITSEFMHIILTELMVPIYHCHPSLGRASEPGPWFDSTKN